MPNKLRPLRAISLAAAVLLPSNVGSSALAEDAVFPEASVAASFAGFAAPQPLAEVVPGAVDITAIDSPTQAEGQSLGSGVASFYASKFHGRRTASGQTFDNGGLTAAHRTLPFGSQLRVTNPANGRSVVVTVNDRGPFTRGRTIDVSRRAAEELGIVARGHATVELHLVG